LHIIKKIFFLISSIDIILFEKKRRKKRKREEKTQKFSFMITDHDQTNYSNYLDYQYDHNPPTNLNFLNISVDEAENGKENQERKKMILTDRDYDEYLSPLDRIDNNKFQKLNSNLSRCDKKFGAQGNFYYNCHRNQDLPMIINTPSTNSQKFSELLSSPQFAIKQTTVDNYTKFHNEHKTGGFDDLYNFSRQCQYHQELKNLNLPNVVKIEDCFYGLPPSKNVRDTSVNIIQEYLDGGITLKEYIDYLKENHHYFEDDNHANTIDLITYMKTLRNLISIIIQVLSTIDTLRLQNIYHNDLHAGNIILMPWSLNSPSLPDSQRYVILENFYQTDSDRKDTYYEFFINNKNSDYFVKIIDWGLMTKKNHLNNLYNIDNNHIDNEPAWIDICQFLNSLLNLPNCYSKIILKSHFSFCQRLIRMEARESARPQYELIKSKHKSSLSAYIDLIHYLYNLYQNYIITIKQINV
jgi:hypothetical protein